MLFFGNSITYRVERKKKIEGQVEVLKKEQKVKVDETTKEFEVKKSVILDSLNANIAACRAQIKALEQEKKDKDELLEQEKKVAIDKVLNMYNAKITSKQNEAKKLGYYIDAEKRNIQDVIDPSQPNAPTEKRILVETVKKPSKKEEVK